MNPLERALTSLEGLSVGDAFGERFFGSGATLIASRALPKPPWRWTDDTAMAVGVVEVLSQKGLIDKDELAQVFARRWQSDTGRGYGSAAHRILEAISQGVPWWSVSRNAFGREGSKGNGGAMRAAPLGAFFADDLDRLIREARASAEVTHAHAEGQAGAVAVALAAAYAHRGLSGIELLQAVHERMPEGETQEGIRAARDMPADRSVGEASRVLGNGSNVTAPDTVPLALFCAAHFMNDFEEAMWQTVSALGDRDTTCAIVGGIVAASGAPIPPNWISSREALPR